ncbi:MAG: hypothetical protein AB7R55_15630 [Gemmatimonadales bacterium]
MSDGDQRVRRAEALVRDLLRRRLVAAAIDPEPLERFVECRGGAPKPVRDGSEVAVATWRHWSDVEERSSGADGELAGWRIQRLVDPPSDATLTDELAVAAAALAIELPGDARLAQVTHLTVAPGRRLARVEWHRYHDGIRVAGDQLVVYVHPETRQAVQCLRRWRALRLSTGPLPPLALEPGVESGSA